MKNKLPICFLAIASVLAACHNTNNNNQKKEVVSTAASSKQDSAIETYIFRGISAAKYDSLGVATMTLRMAPGSGKGIFVYKIDYGNGQKLKPYSDSGIFHSEDSPEFGSIYVLQGQQAAPFYYQPMDNELYALTSKKKATDNVLTGIDLQDSLQPREQVLAAYNKEKKSVALGGTVWSSIKQQQIDYKDATVKLGDISGDAKAPSAYVLFDKDQSHAELFLPKATKGLLLKRTGAEGNYIWTDGHYELFQWKGYVLRYKNGASIFAGDLQ